MIKSPYFYDKGAVHLDKIVFQPEDSGAAGVAALQAGDIQMLDGVSATQLSALQSSGVHLIKVDSLGWRGIQINIGNSKGVDNLPDTNVGKPLASSPLLRQAFEEAIDRSTLVRVVFQGAAVPDCLPIPPTSPAYDATVKCTPYNPEDARKLVAESGLHNPTVQLTSTGTATNAVLDQFIQSEEAAVGINVTINAVDNPTLVSLESSGNFDTLVGGWTGSPAIDRNVFQFLATTGSATSAATRTRGST